MSGPNARSAPKGWVVVAELAEKHADELAGQVEKLRALAAELRGPGSR